MEMKKNHLTDETVLQDRYRMDRELGRGGMGIVHKAFDSLLERDVAIKILLETAVAGTEGRNRLLAEARAAARLDHPNIVTVYDVSESDSSPFIVMQFIDGQSLMEYRPETLEETVAIMEQVCEALENAHGEGIIHRDIKPANVMLTADGTAKLTDFGLARSIDARLTVEGGFAGTLDYMAPEQALGQTVDGRTDL